MRHFGSVEAQTIQKKLLWLAISFSLLSLFGGSLCSSGFVEAFGGKKKKGEEEREREREVWEKMGNKIRASGFVGVGELASTQLTIYCPPGDPASPFSKFHFSKLYFSFIYSFARPHSPPLDFYLSSVFFFSEKIAFFLFIIRIYIRPLQFLFFKKKKHNNHKKLYEFWCNNPASQSLI